MRGLLLSVPFGSAHSLAGPPPSGPSALLEPDLFSVPAPLEDVEHLKSWFLGDGAPPRPPRRAVRFAHTLPSAARTRCASAQCLHWRIRTAASACAQQLTPIRPTATSQRSPNIHLVAAVLLQTLSNVRGGLLLTTLFEGWESALSASPAAFPHPPAPHRPPRARSAPPPPRLLTPPLQKKTTAPSWASSACSSANCQT